MKCKRCGKEVGTWERRRMLFCSDECANAWATEGNNEPVTVMVIRVPEIFKELRPRLGERIRAIRRKSYTSTAYVYERAGKKVLLRADEVVEVNG